MPVRSMHYFSVRMYKMIALRFAGSDIPGKAILLPGTILEGRASHASNAASFQRIFEATDVPPDASVITVTSLPYGKAWPVDTGARGGALAPWAVPVAAAVIGDPPVPAVGAGLDMPAERGGAAMFDRRHDLELVQAQMSGMGGAVGWPGSAEDVGDLE